MQLNKANLAKLAREITAILRPTEAQKWSARHPGEHLPPSGWLTFFDKANAPFAALPTTLDSGQPITYADSGSANNRPTIANGALALPRIAGAGASVVYCNLDAGAGNLLTRIGVRFRLDNTAASTHNWAIGIALTNANGVASNGTAYRIGAHMVLNKDGVAISKADNSSGSFVFTYFTGGTVTFASPLVADNFTTYDVEMFRVGTTLIVVLPDKRIAVMTDPEIANWSLQWGFVEPLMGAKATDDIPVITEIWTDTGTQYPPRVGGLVTGDMLNKYVTLAGPSTIAQATINTPTINVPTIVAYDDDIMIYSKTAGGNRAGMYNMDNITDPAVRVVNWPDANGTMALTSDVSAAQAAAIAASQPGDADLTAVANANNSAALGLWHTVRARGNTAYTYTIASGSVTQISGTLLDTGITAAVNDLVLIDGAPATTGVGTASSTNPGNGIYRVTAIGANTTVARAAEMSGSVVPYGHLVRVLEGSSGASSAQTGRIFACTQPTTGAFTWGTTALQFGDFYDGRNAVASYANTDAVKAVRGTSATGGAGGALVVAAEIDVMRWTAIGAAVTSLAISGTPYHTKVVTIEWTDNGTARAIVRGSSFIALTAPMAGSTIPGSTIREQYMWNGVNSKWECISSVITNAGRVKFVEYTYATLTGSLNTSGIPVPPGAVAARVTIIPGGAPGASGRRGAAGTFRGGGAAGANQVSQRDVTLSLPAATYSIILGNPGAGGAAVTTDNTNGNAGTNVGVCSFTCGTSFLSTASTSLISGFPGTGTSGDASSGNPVIYNPLYQSPAFFLGGGPAGTSATPQGSDGLDSWSPAFPSGSGGGGSITAADVAGNGGASGRNRMHTSAVQYAGGIVDSTAPVAGIMGATGIAGAGGGGGAASKTAAAQAGTNGVGYGVAGGGGGASLNGFNSGKGGDGGPAYMRIEWVYA